jgi:AcrR family transcriptional regulator
MVNRKNQKRLSREQWLALALEEVAKVGGAKLRIDKLVQSLGVTKGSFYWHFKNRDDFVQSLAEFWARYTTGQVIERLAQVKGDAKDRLLTLMEIIFTIGLDKYELPMRAWAAEEPHIAHLVQEAEAQRLAFIRSILAEMGFQGSELEMRARVFVCYAAGEHVFFTRENVEEQQKTIKAVHAFFTRP